MYILCWAAIISLSSKVENSSFGKGLCNYSLFISSETFLDFSSIFVYTFLSLLHFQIFLWEYILNLFVVHLFPKHLTNANLALDPIALNKSPYTLLPIESSFLLAYGKTEMIFLGPLLLCSFLLACSICWMILASSRSISWNFCSDYKLLPSVLSLPM